MTSPDSVRRITCEIDAIRAYLPHGRFRTEPSLREESGIHPGTAVLVLGRQIGEGVMIGHDVKITVVDVAGGLIRIGIDAPPTFAIHREEVYLEIQREDA
jgi:carbon storage regulator